MLKSLVMTSVECMWQRQVLMFRLRIFDSWEICTLVVVGKLQEGYDNKYVSLVAIVHSIAPTSHVLFAQFIGRAVHKIILPMILLMKR